MLNKNISAVAECLARINAKSHSLHSSKSTHQILNKYLIHTCVQKNMLTPQSTIKHLHLNSKPILMKKSLKFYNNIQYQFTTNNNQPQTKLNYNNFNVINDLHNISQNNNKFHFTPEKHAFLSKQYPTVSLDLEKKLEKVETILHSQQKNLYKIVQEILIVLEAFAQTKRRQIIQENVVKVVKEFNKKIISAYLQNVQNKQVSETERRKSEIKEVEGENTNIQQTDNDYLLHQNYSSPLPDLGDKDFNNISGSSTGIIDEKFIFYYIETLKTWFLNRIETDSIIRQAQQQLFELFAAREVSDLQEILKSTMQQLIRNYIEEPSAKKREAFPFELKLRGISFLSFFQNKQHVEKYLQRLADQNMFIYMKESQILSLMYDITEIQPNLSNLTNFVYQIQSTRVYQNLSTLNGAYMKALFITYTRKFMVSYQEIQFYELFRDIEPKIKYPTIRTFIRLIEILKAQAADLHCEYNKVMNKYNYNIIISIITSMTYTVDNTKFDELFLLFDSLNSVQKSGQILYEQMARYLKNYVARQNYTLTEKETQKIYGFFLHVIQQAKPIYKYEEKQGLNKEFGKKSIILLNVLFDILFKSHPEIVLIGSRYVKSYLLWDENSILTSVGGLPFDDRLINIQLQNSVLIETKLQKVKSAFNQLIETNKQSEDLLDAILIFLKSQVHLIKGENENVQGQNFLKFPQNFKLLQYIYATEPAKSFQECLFAKILKPIIKDIAEGLSTTSSKKSVSQLRKLTRKLYKTLDCLNTLNPNKDILSQIETQLTLIKRSLVSQIKQRLQEREKQQERKRVLDIETLAMATPKGNIEILLCINELSRLSQKVLAHNNVSPQQPYLFLQDLPSIYNFINKIAVQNIKSIQQSDLIPMLTFINSLDEARTSQTGTVLLLQIDTLVYQYLYSSMSVFILYLGDRGKYYLKLNNANAELLLSVLNHFVSNKKKFRTLSSKKRLVILQIVLVGLIRKKHLKVTSAHLKRSQHAKILLSFLEIFQYPENLNVDLKKLIEEVEFLASDLQEFSNDILQRYSDMNWSISRYLEDNKVGLASSKKLSKLTVEQLRKQFDEGKSSKIYEMILRNSKYQLPFELPEPKSDDQNTKLVYIIEKIYQKIANKNNYGVPKMSSKGTVPNSKNKKFKKLNQLAQQILNDQQQATPKVAQQQQQQIKQVEMLIFQDTEKASQQPLNGLTRFQQIDLEQQKLYVKRQSLVSYIYEDHYKMTQNKLPLHFKKQTWKNLSSFSKQLEIQSLEIDQKIDQNIYKQVMLALLGYVEKVKIVAKEFHSHSFIQYVAAQLDMEVYFHGCIARISRKNKPEDNVLFVCSIESNYKLLYICTHILRESGENAFIVSDKTRDNDFREFLQKILPQPFEPEESEIVDKVVKGEIAIDGEENSVIREGI